MAALTSHRPSERDLAGRAVVLKVDTERFPSLAAQYNVRSIPNFGCLSEGKLQFQQAGSVEHYGELAYARHMTEWRTRKTQKKRSSSGITPANVAISS